MRHLDTPQSVCRLGVVRCDITPPVGIYHRMWGAATHDRATGVHRPLTATALAFRPADAPPSAGSEQLVLAIDHCLLWADEMKALLAVICDRTGLAAEQITVAFGHTHGAGLMGRERVDLPGGELIPPYLDRLAGSLTEIAGEARRSAKEVTIAYGTGRCSLAAHRDFWDESAGQFVCGFNPTGPADDSVLVARATDTDGRPVATVVNYACHPTTLAWQNTLISPDYPGAMRELVEQATGAPCVFLQGASGDLGPREGYVGDPAVADRNGRQLGHAALAVLESLLPPLTRFAYTGPVVSGATLGTWDHVPLSPEALREKARWRLRRWEVELPYHDGLPTPDHAEAERRRCLAEEQSARAAGDASRARDCRAMAERWTRWLARLAVLPPGPMFRLPVVLWQNGDAFWLAVEGEHYQLLQRALRDRFPGVPLVVMTIANGSRPMYLPVREAYRTGMYQESVAVLAPGCLEAVIEAVAAQVGEWLENAAGAAGRDTFGPAAGPLR